MHAMKACRGVELQLYSFLTYRFQAGEWWVSPTGRLTPQGNILQYPLCRRLGGLQVRSGRSEEEQILLPAKNRITFPR